MSTVEAAAAPQETNAHQYDQVQENLSSVGAAASLSGAAQNPTKEIVEGQVSSVSVQSEDNKDQAPQILKLEDAEELSHKGCQALKTDNYSDAIDYFSRALEIRVAHYGELAVECASTYYQYGRALFLKVQEEALNYDEEPSPEKGEAPVTESNACDDQPPPVTATLENPLTAAESSEPPPTDDEAKNEAPASDGRTDATEKGQASEAYGSDLFAIIEEEEEEEGDDDEDAEVEEGDKEQESDYDYDSGEELDEEETDLDLAWKMLDIARVILEQKGKSYSETHILVDVITALGDVSLEREDFQTCLNDYSKALCFLEAIVDSDSQKIAELCFKICLALQSWDKPTEALKYCERAVKICESRLQIIKDELDTLKKTNETPVQVVNTNSPVATSNEAKRKEFLTEMGEITQLLIDYKEKVEELQQLASTAPFDEAVRSFEAKHINRSSSRSSSSREGEVKTGFDSPTTTTATSERGITHLGVVGRGLKRVRAVPGGRGVKRTWPPISEEDAAAEAAPAKRMRVEQIPATNPDQMSDHETSVINLQTSESCTK